MAAKSKGSKEKVKARLWIQRTQSELGQEQTQSAMDAAQAAAQKAADDQAWEEKKPKKTASGTTMAGAAGSLLPDRSLGLAQALAKLSRPLKIVQSYPQS